MTDKFRVIIATVTDFSNYELLKNKCDEFLQDKIAKGIGRTCIVPWIGLSKDAA